MGWFAAAIIYETKIDKQEYPHSLRECSVRILLADSEDIAWARAKEIGTEGEHSYENAEGETVFWKFREVAEVQDLCEDTLSDGAEVFSRIWRT